MTDNASFASCIVGQSGKVTNVTADQGLITYKSLVVYFNTSVLKLPDGSPPPKSLLSCITVGDMLHYDAVLTYNKIDPSQFFYEATRVWFPHNKVINRQPPTVTAPLPPTADKTIRKNIRKHVKKTLTKDGPLPLYNLYTSLNPDHHSYLKHSIDGLKNIITSNSNYFCLVDNVVHLIPNPDTDNVPTNTSTPTGTEELWGPNLVTKTIQILKSHLKSNGYMTLQQLYDIVSTTNDQHIKKFACTNIGSFQSFLSVHADIFLQSPDGMVSLRKPLSAERKKTAAKQTPNQEAHKDLEAVAVTYVENLLRTASPLHICKLHECVQNGPPNLKQIVGAKHKSLRTFLLQHKGVFRMLPNDLVVLTKDSGPYFSSDDVSVLPDSIDFLKNILMAKGGSLTIAQLVGYLGGASPKIRKCIGGSPASLKAFLKNHSQVFEIDKSDKVRCIENIETKRKSRVQTMPTFYRGIVVYVGPAFGFIKHGQLEADNIYFDVLCYMESEEIEPVKKLNSLITVGDTVDCLYVPNQGEKQTSYRAVALWKIPCETESNSIVVSPVTVLPSPVLLGDARISYLRDDVGYLLADISDKEDFVKGPVSLVVFNLKFVGDPRNCGHQLKMGDCIKYIAMQKSSSKMAKLKCWNVVSLWPSKSQRETNTLTRELSESSLFSVTANLREMTSEGGDLTFGPDSWAHRVSFSWEQVLSHFVSKSLVAQLDDRFWCIVKNDVMMGVTKWVADELIKCDSNLEPPERFKACSKVCLPSTQFSLGRDSGLGGSGETLFNSDSGSSLLTPPLKSENLMDQNLSDIFDRNLNFADYCLGVNPIAPDVNLMKTDVDKTDDDDDDPWTALTDQKYDSIMDGTGTVISKTAYGGVLETTADIAIPFDAHSFYFNGRPISHLVVDVGSRVHFNARQVGQDANLVAFQVWMGTKPQSNSKLLN